MSPSRSIVLAFLAFVAMSCSLDHPSTGPGPCGGEGQRCCRPDEVASMAGRIANGCANDHICVAGRDSMDAGVPGGRVCRRCPSGQTTCGASMTNGGTCVNLSNDRLNCGTCGNMCPAGQECAPTSAGTGGTDGGVARDAGGAAPGMCRQVCPGGQTFCSNVNGGCVDLNVNTNNCGTCGVVCPAGQACTAGRCSCSPGQTFCTGIGCVNVMTDTRACGMCGRACNPGEECSGGVCRCPGGVATRRFCMNAGTCVDTNTDRNNCGSCGNACMAGQDCVNGACNCGASGLSYCSALMRCIDLQTDNNNCGACGTVCPAGQRCAGGMCTCGIPGQTFCAGVGCTNLATDVNNCGTNAMNGCGRACNGGEVCRMGVCQCPIAGQVFCAGVGCINPMTDTNNCGTGTAACGRRCPEGQFCSSGTCRCPSGLTACMPTGSTTPVCVDLTTSTANCGACGTNCDATIPNAFGNCVSNTCRQTACRPGFGDCNSMAGCETNTNTDPNNCGACSNRCRFANATANCVTGACTMGPCNAGFADCDRDPSNGCETNVNTDTTNCRTCGNICPTMSGRAATCVAGVCGVSTCAPGLADCDANGSCETTLATTATSCGACGRACNNTNGSPTCAGGACVRIDCNTGFGDCDTNVANGCEVDFSSNTSHCGGCGRPCVFPNATATCTSSSCRLGTCTAGFGNCDSSTTNGCETSLSSDNLNCGACGRICSGGKVCTSGSCTCPTGTTDCSGTCINIMGSDNANCGACGRACGGGQTCVAGTCTCPSGQTLCAGTCTNTLTDNNNCGPAGATSCGRVCGSGTRCSAGACVTTCPTGQMDCTSVGAGCVNTSTSLEHCGGCGMACSSVGGTSTCASGACRITCNSGVGNCDGNALNGCEQTLNTLAHCGGCSMPCNATRIANGTAFACTTGTCLVTDCTTNFIPNTAGTACIACGSNLQPVCSTPDPPCMTGFAPNPLTMSPQLCNTCGGATQLACTSPPVCTTGLTACTLVSMGISYDVCYNLQTAADHCGSCTGTCVGAPNSNGTCASGRCVCTGQSGDCNDNRADGCETNLNTDNNNCGTCGFVCPTGTPRCTGGTCGI